tara:strand:- start:2102 stop:2689 length:588 start_codon:yes stop_codon:yes gene_type:complete
MAQQVINIGTGNNTGNGDENRTCWIKSNANFTELYNFHQITPRFGVYNYDNTLSALTVLATTWTTIPNNALGTDTLTTGGLTGVDIYNPLTSQFDYSGLSVFDSVDYVFKAIVNTSAVNQEVKIRLLVGVGTLDIPLEFSETSYKVAGAHSLTVFLQNHLFTNAIKSAPAEIQIWSEAACTLDVRGWYVKASKRV